MALRTLARNRIGRIFHVAWPRMKHEENSDRGDAEAKRRGDPATDLDLTMSVADPNCPLVGDYEHGPGDVCRGHVLNNHWLRLLLRDRFVDPLKRIGKRARIDRLTWPKIHRLYAVTRGRRYRVRRIKRAFRHCKRLGRRAVVEPKGDPRFRELWVWENIAAAAEATGCTVSVRALPENAAALIPARRAGFEAWEI